jgi:phospholipid transport system transporter-binding protein
MPAKNKQPLVAFDHTSTVVGETLMLAGALNLANMSRLLAETAEYIAQPTLPEVLVIDFAEVSDVDSSGVALLLHWRREALRLGKALRYVHLPPNLVSLAELYSVNEIIHCPSQKQTSAVAVA